jgi:hypothetical protein
MPLHPHYTEALLARFRRPRVSRVGAGDRLKLFVVNKREAPDWRERLVCPRCGSRQVDLVSSGATRRQILDPNHVISGYPVRVHGGKPAETSLRTTAEYPRLLALQILAHLRPPRFEEPDQPAVMVKVPVAASRATRIAGLMPSATDAVDLARSSAPAALVDSGAGRPRRLHSRFCRGTILKMEGTLCRKMP